MMVPSLGTWAVKDFCSLSSSKQTQVKAGNTEGKKKEKGKKKLYNKEKSEMNEVWIHST